MQTFIATLLNRTYFIDDIKLFCPYCAPCMCDDFVNNAIGAAPEKIKITVNTAPFEGAHRATRGDDYDTVNIPSIPKYGEEEGQARFLWSPWRDWLVNNNVTEAYFKIEPA